MNITIESTNTITTVDGAKVRQWKGITEGGVECFVFVARIAVRDDRDFSQFEKELNETGKPAELNPVDLGTLLV